MNLFFDTSALVKFFHEEEGTEIVTKLVTPQENNIWILEVARLEFISALCRRFRSKEIDENKLAAAILSFEEEITLFNIEPLSQMIIHEAEVLLKKYGKISGLRTLDALQLGAFNLICEKDWFFVTSDDNLCNIVELIGFKTINPSISLR